jgi:hypothetical protein
MTVTERTPTIFQVFQIGSAKNAEGRKIRPSFFESILLIDFYEFCNRPSAMQLADFLRSKPKII